MIILCKNCGGAIEVNPETSPKKKARCPYCKKLIFKRTGNVVEWAENGKQWCKIIAYICVFLVYCMIMQERFKCSKDEDKCSKDEEITYSAKRSSKARVTRGAGLIECDCFGATTKDIYDELFSILVNGSKEAFMRVLLARTLAGEAKIFHAGERVHVVDSSWTMNKVMGEKDLVGYWIPYEYVIER